MSITLDKALGLLNHFNAQQPSLGLSEMARQAKLDKATTRRLLLSLMRNGLIEQDPESRAYTLGAELLRLAHVRESTVPLQSTVQPILEKLANETGETAHFSVLSGDHLVTAHRVESTHSLRVSVNYDDPLPLHCTASGLAFLSHQSDEFIQTVLEKPLRAYTTSTQTDPDFIYDNILQARTMGFAHIKHGFEDEAEGLAAGVFSKAGFVIGAVAVVAPSLRMNELQFSTMHDSVIQAAASLTRAQGGIWKRIGAE